MLYEDVIEDLRQGSFPPGSISVSTLTEFHLPFLLVIQAAETRSYLH